MKKSYEAPVLIRREALSKVTAQVVKAVTLFHDNFPD